MYVCMCVYVCMYVLLSVVVHDDDVLLLVKEEGATDREETHKERGKCM